MRSDIEIQTTDLSIPSSDSSFSIPIKIRQPINEPELRSIILFIHGGIFAHGSKECHPSIAEALALGNSVVITASFRNGKVARWKSGVTLCDLRDVLDWIEEERTSGVRLSWRDLMVGLVGSSSVRFYVVCSAYILRRAHYSQVDAH
jgi:acetyl esterase/lipase